MRTSYNGYVRIMAVELFYICYMMTERHAFLWLYDEAMSVSEYARALLEAA